MSHPAERFSLPLWATDVLCRWNFYTTSACVAQVCVAGATTPLRDFAGHTLPVQASAAGNHGDAHGREDHAHRPSAREAANESVP